MSFIEYKGILIDAIPQVKRGQSVFWDTASENNEPDLGEFAAS